MTSDPGDGDSTPLCEPGLIEASPANKHCHRGLVGREAGLLWNVEHHIGDRP